MSLLESIAHEGDLECDRCKRIFQDATECGQHMLTCRTKINQQSALGRQHLKRTKQRPIDRNKMKLKNSHVHKLNELNQAQTDQNQFVCLHAGCGKQFSCKDALLRHNRTHSNVKSFVCTEPMCGQQFTRSDNFRRHLRGHSGDTPFACYWPNCDKKFTDKGRLSEHYRCHASVKPYVCTEPMCGKRFSRNSYLISHVRIHTGVRPFVCTTCDKNFRCKRGLEAHKRSLEHQKSS